MQVECGKSNVSVPVARSLPYVIESVATVVAKDISSEEWAARVRIPNRKFPGKLLGGEDITRITGVERKAWDPEHFGNFDPIVDAVRETLARAKASPADVDLVIIMTATPFFPQLSADGFELMQRLGFRDDVAPIQLQTGCAAMA